MQTHRTTTAPIGKPNSEEYGLFTQKRMIRAAFCSTNLTAKEKIVFEAIVHAMNGKSKEGKVFLTSKRLAADTGSETRTVERAIRGLREAGWVRTEREPRGCVFRPAWELIENEHRPQEDAPALAEAAVFEASNANVIPFPTPRVSGTAHPVDVQEMKVADIVVPASDLSKLIEETGTVFGGASGVMARIRQLESWLNGLPKENRLKALRNCILKKAREGKPTGGASDDRPRNRTPAEAYTPLTLRDGSELPAAELRALHDEFFPEWPSLRNFRYEVENLTQRGSAQMTVAHVRARLAGLVREREEQRKDQAERKRKSGYKKSII